LGASRHLVTQHLLLGINAHINLDLGVLADLVDRMQEAIAFTSLGRDGSTWPDCVSTRRSSPSVSDVPAKNNEHYDLQGVPRSIST
jgi:hypothetical protein